MSLFSKFLGVVTVSLGLAILAVPAFAEFTATYSTDKFVTAQKEGKHIIVEVFKQGCGTCKAQQPSLKKAKTTYPEAVFLSIDFLDNAEAVKKFKVIKQSTIIVFKGKDEVARLVGETGKDKILAAIAKGV